MVDTAWTEVRFQVNQGGKISVVGGRAQHKAWGRSCSSGGVIVGVCCVHECMTVYGGAYCPTVWIDSQMGAGTRAFGVPPCAWAEAAAAAGRSRPPMPHAPLQLHTFQCSSTAVPLQFHCSSTAVALPSLIKAEVTTLFVIRGHNELMEAELER